MVFVLCTLPVAVGRIATISSVDVSVGYYCFAGVLISANGFFDCAVFGSTRAVPLGSAEQVNARSTDLGRCSFMRTPASHFGNGVWVQGGTPCTRVDPNPGVGGWWSSRRSHSEGGDQLPCTGSTTWVRSTSQEAPRAEQQQQPNDLAIHMDVVTSFTVEANPTRAREITRWFL
jgi:hypothetical protein